MSRYSWLNEGPESSPITQGDLDQIETYADRLFAKVGIDVEFTQHFIDRVNDARDQKQISMAELTRLFKQQYKKNGKKIAQLGPGAEAVMKDMQTDVNMPFALVWDKQSQELDLIAKTVMRKKNFGTSNPVVAVEQVVRENKIVKHPTEVGAYLITLNDKEYKIAKHLNNNERHAGEWSIFTKSSSKFTGDEWEWVDTVYSRSYAIDRLKDFVSQNMKEAQSTLKLPNIDVGDEVMVGKFKNRKATVKGFDKDDNNQPVLKTNKGDQKLFKPRIRKLMDYIDESVNYVKPQFDVEWEEANRYPYLEKLGPEGWEELAKSGREVSVTNDSVKKIGNTGADGSESLDDLEPDKVARLKQAMELGTIEMPIVVKQPDGSLELVAGNTRLIGLISTQSKANVWLIDASRLTEAFKPHMMYNPKTGEGKMAKVEDDHLRMKKMGWGHDKPTNEAVEVDISGNAEKGYVLSKIVVPKELRGTGVGSKVMKDLIDKADNEHAIIALTPDTAFGGAKGRLIQFYKRFGFVPNKGRNKDFRYRETMIRYPKEVNKN
jgi:GNAT superfamily N-acetyltransferase